MRNRRKTTVGVLLAACMLAGMAGTACDIGSMLEGAGDGPSDTTIDLEDAGDGPSDTTIDLEDAGDGPSDTTINTDLWIKHPVGCDAIEAFCCDRGSDASRNPRIKGDNNLCPRYCPPGHRPVLGESACIEDVQGHPDADGGRN